MRGSGDGAEGNGIKSRTGYLSMAACRCRGFLPLDWVFFTGIGFDRIGFGGTGSGWFGVVSEEQRGLRGDQTRKR